MESTANFPVREEITSEMVSDLPNLWTALKVSRNSSYMLRSFIPVVLTIWGAIAYSSPALWWCAAILSLTLAAKFRLYVGGMCMFARRSIEGWIISEQDGQLIATRDGVEAVNSAITDCMWSTVPDLAQVPGNSAFPHRSVIVIYPNRNAGWISISFQLLFGRPFFVCGLTEQTRSMWRNMFLSYGVAETVSLCQSSHACERQNVKTSAS